MAGARRIRTDWTEAEAIDMLAQGYSVEAVAARTGFRKAWLLEQKIPRRTALQKAREKIGA